jgi:recombination protein RecA
MPSLALIRAHVESRIPGALTLYERATPDRIATGIPSIDQEIGGIPKGGLTQLCAPGGVSSGRTALLMSLLAQVTGKEEFCAIVDASDCFDPESASASGVHLSRLLWVRCSGRGMKSVEQAFKAGDILIQNGGFGLVALDLGDIEETLVRRIPLTTWFRFARVMEKLPTALVVLLTHSAAQSCAALTLQLGNAAPTWSGSAIASHSRLIANVECDLEIARARMKKPVQGEHSRFAVRPKWA